MKTPCKHSRLLGNGLCFMAVGRVAVSPEPRESQESKGRGTAAEEDYRSSDIVLFLSEVAQNSDKVLLLKGYQHQ